MASRFTSRLRVIVRALVNILSKRSNLVQPRRILIAHQLLLGDTLMLTPLLAKLREQYPQAEIIMAAPKAVTALYEGRPYGVRALPYDPHDLQTWHALRKEAGFDLALVPGDNRYSWLAKALGARHIVAFAGDRPAYKNWPVNRLVPYPNQPAAWGDMVAGLVPGPAPTPYQASDWPDPACTDFERPTTPYCVLHVGASSPLRLWEPEKWRALADALATQGYSVVWSGGRGEENWVAAVDPQGRYPSYAGRLDLPQLWHLLKGASLLVCPDTGIAHLGRLTGTPTVALFGPGSTAVFGAGDFWRDSPYATVTIDPFPCRDQHSLFKREISWIQRCGRTLKECPSPRCMHAISLEAVASATRLLLNKIPAN